VNREQILTILYDITATLAGEAHVESLLTKMLQRLMFHSGCSAACILLKDTSAFPTLASVIGDAVLMQHSGQSIEVPDELMSFESRYEEDISSLSFLPCRQNRYRAFLCLDIPGRGKAVLLYRHIDEFRLPLELVLQPVMANFSQQIDLCRLNDNQQQHLESLVETRTQELEQRQMLLSLLLESIPEGVYGIDLEGRFIFANPACLNMLGYSSAQEILGKVCHDEIHHHHEDHSPYPVTDCHIYNAYKNSKAVSCDNEVFWRKDGSSFPVEYRSLPILDQREVKGAVVTFRDVREEREQRDKLEHMQRLESLGLLAGGIAHDFNNILTAIMGNAALAANMLDSHSPVQDFLSRIEDSTQRAADLCKQMLAYSGKGRFIIKPIDLSELVEHMTRLMEVSIDKNVVIKYHLTENLPSVEADVAQLQQVILNLITNANEAINGQSGVISFATGVMQADDAYLRTSVTQEKLPEGNYVFLEVSDTGKGMDEVTKKKMFDPFFSTKFIGRGLGMSAVLGIIRGHKGAIRCYSEERKGTTIKVLFPVDERKASPLVRQNEPAGHWRGNGTVLIVDDEETIREMASMMIEDFGFSTITACDGIDALEKLETSGDSIVAVLLDMTMPRMDGVACFSKMKQLYPDIKVMLSSGYNEQDATQRFAGKGLAGFIQKPYAPEQLMLKMKALFSDE